MSRNPSATELLESILSGKPRVQNWSYWLPAARLLRIIPWSLQFGGLALVCTLPLVGVDVLSAGILGIAVSFAGVYLGQWSDALNPIEQVVILQDSIFVKRITRNVVIQHQNVKRMKFTPARDDDYDEMQRGRRFYEAQIMAKGRRLKTNCWLLVTEAEANRLVEWLTGEKNSVRGYSTSGGITFDASEL